MTEEDSESGLTESQVGEENDLPVIQLCGLVEELSYGNSALKIETGMFEKYYNKLEPRDQRHPRLSDGKVVATAEFSQFRSRQKSKSRVGLTSLTVDQKCELVQKELEDTKDELRHMRANAERDLQHHEAIIEEAEIRWAEVKKAVYDFEKDILKTISKKKGSILATQKVLKYIEDMNRQRDSTKDKLRLKNVSLKVQRRKLLLQLRQTPPRREAFLDPAFFPWPGRGATVYPQPVCESSLRMHSLRPGGILFTQISTPTAYHHGWHQANAQYRFVK